MTIHGPPLRRIGQLHDIGAQAQQSTQIVWRQIDGQRSLPAPCPAFLFGGNTAVEGRTLFGRIDLPACGCFGLQDAVIGPAGVLIKDGTAFYGEALGITKDTASAVVARLNARAATTLTIASPLVSLFGASVTHADIVTEVLPLLWLLTMTGHALETLQFLVPIGVSRADIVLLNACGITEAQLIICRHADEVVRSPRVIAPARLRSGVRFSPVMRDATRFWTERVRHALALPAHQPRRALLLSPQGTSDTNAVAGWDVIEAASVSAGMTALRPASLECRERMVAFSEASCVIGIDGEALREACVFAPPGAAICAIRGTGAPALSSVGLASVLGHRLGYAFGDCDPEHTDAPAVMSRSTLDGSLAAITLMTTQ